MYFASVIRQAFFIWIYKGTGVHETTFPLLIALLTLADSNHYHSLQSSVASSHYSFYEIAPNVREPCEKLGHRETVVHCVIYIQCKLQMPYINTKFQGIKPTPQPMTRNIPMRHRFLGIHSSCGCQCGRVIAIQWGHYGGSGATVRKRQYWRLKTFKAQIRHTQHVKLLLKISVAIPVYYPVVARPVLGRGIAVQNVGFYRAAALLSARP